MKYAVRQKKKRGQVAKIQENDNRNKLKWFTYWNCCKRSINNYDYYVQENK